MIQKYTYPPQTAHNQTYFYKYASPIVAKIILQNNTLRWSHPYLFNDSFELQIKKKAYANIEELRRAMKRCAISHVRNYQHALQNSIDYSKEKDPWKNFLQICDDSIYEIDNAYRQFSDGYLNALIECYKKIGILCLSESCDNILLWSHYADCHRGIVLRFTVQTEESEDDPFVMAQKVQYSSQTMQLTNAENIIESILYERENSLSDFFPTHCYVKQDIWKYENEWRLIDFCTDIDENKMFDDVHFKINKLSGIYFGCKCSPETYIELSKVIETKYPHADKFMSVMNEDKYELLFKRI